MDVSECWLSQLTTRHHGETLWGKGSRTQHRVLPLGWENSVPCHGHLSFRGTCSGVGDEASLDARLELTTILDQAHITQDLILFSQTALSCFLGPCNTLCPTYPLISFPHHKKLSLFSFVRNLRIIFLFTLMEGNTLKCTCRFTMMCAPVLCLKAELCSSPKCPKLSNA